MIPLFRVNMSPDAPDKAALALSSGWIGQGPRVEEFEDALAQIPGFFRRPVTTSSCTAALEIALRLCYARGRYVISTPMTCTATSAAIVNSGARILWADVDPISGLIDPESVMDLVMDYGPSAVAAIVAVDWGGARCDYQMLGQTGIPVISDSAHVFDLGFGEYEPDFACYSFQAIKHLTTGDGGALVCRAAENDEIARRMRWFGLERGVPGWSQEPLVEGFKAHMNDIAAAIGLANLPVARLSVTMAQNNARAYMVELEGDQRPGVFGLPPAAPSAWWLFTIQVDSPADFMAHMKLAGIETSPVHVRNDKMALYAGHSDNPRRDGAGLAMFNAHHVAIPVGWWLSSEDRYHVIQSIRDYVWSRRCPISLAAASPA